MAGLVAAQRLAAAGLEVALCEAETQTGGRAALARVAAGLPRSGEAGDGSLWDPLWGRDTAARDAVSALARRPRSAGEGVGGVARVASPPQPLLPPRSPSIWQLSPARGVLPLDPRDGGIPRHLRFGCALRLARLERLLRRFAPLLDPTRPERAAPLDDRSLGDFARLYLGTGLLSQWAEPWLSAVTPVEEDHTSRVAFLLHLGREMGRDREGEGDGAGEDAALGAAPAVPPRGEVALYCRTRVEALAAGRKAGIDLRAQGAGWGALHLAARAVILAVPAARARQLAAPLLGAAERRALGALPSEPIAVWGAGLIALPDPLAEAMAGETGRGLRIRIPRCRSQLLSTLQITDTEIRAVLRPAAAEALGAAARTGGQGRGGGPRAAHRDLDRRLAGELKRLFPGLRMETGDPSTALQRAESPRFAVGGYRQLARLRQAEQSARCAGRRLYFAGDYTVGASLGGAARSGARAAAELLADLGPAT